jgi:hypothetical protein
VPVRWLWRMPPESCTAISSRQIMVTDESQIKILDFGLAKLATIGSCSEEETQTEPPAGRRMASGSSRAETMPRDLDCSRSLRKAVHPFVWQRRQD